MNRIKTFSMSIFLSLTISPQVGGQSLLSKAPPPKGLQKLPDSKSRPSPAKSEFERQLDGALAPALKAINQIQSDSIKAKGGIQDGGGGSEAESELAKMMYDWSLQFYYLNTNLFKLKLISINEWQRFTALFPRRSKELNLCIYIFKSKDEAVCRSSEANVVISENEWKSLPNESKKMRALQEIVRLLGFQSERSLEDIAFELSQVLTAKGAGMHRYDVVERLADGTMVAIRNMNPDKRDLIRLEQVKGAKSNYHNIVILQQDIGQTISYRVDPKEGYFNVEMCGDSFKDEPFVEILSEQFKYNEFKPLVERCQNRLNSGQAITTIFVSGGLRLVLNCR